MFEEDDTYTARQLAALARVHPRTVLGWAVRAGVYVRRRSNVAYRFTRDEARVILAHRPDRRKIPPSNGWAICLYRCQDERTHTVMVGEFEIKTCELCHDYHHAEGAEARRIALLLEERHGPPPLPREDEDDDE